MAKGFVDPLGVDFALEVGIEASAIVIPQLVDHLLRAFTSSRLPLRVPLARPRGAAFGFLS